MSFELGFYKDVLLNKLGAAKDRAAAAIRQLDNCDVQLRIVNKNTRTDNDKMPVVRSRSKSKCKHSYSHEEERLHGPRYYDDWSSDDGYESDCSCSDHGPVGRGRKTRRDADVFIDGSHADQQNILIKDCCRGRRRGEKLRHDRPRGRPMICVDFPRRRPYDEWSRRPCHPDGRCCIHGFGYNDYCSRCPSGERAWRQPVDIIPHQKAYYRVITDDDGKMNMYDGAKLTKHLCDQYQAWSKAEADKKSANEQKISDAMHMINKMCKPAGLGGCTCGGGSHGSCGSSFDTRSAQEIEGELAMVNADLDQLHTRALLAAQHQARANIIDHTALEDLAICSGALQDIPMERTGKECSRIKQKPLKSILMSPSTKKVHFSGVESHEPVGRVMEVDDEEHIASKGRPRDSCTGCTEDGQYISVGPRIM